ncbi:MAG: phosphatidate cytidylyltransferase [Christensenellaceae bacterium]
MLTRIVVGIGIAAVFAALLYLQGIYILIVFLLFSLIAQYEILRTIKAGDIKTMDAPVYLFTLALYPAYHFFAMQGVFALYVATIMSLFIIKVFANNTYDYKSIVFSGFTLLYPQLFMLYFYQVISVGDPAVSRMMLLLTVAAASGSDIFAYFVGVLFGKHKLCPDISPNKTVEGAVGGLLGAVFLTLAVVLLFGEKQVSLYIYLIAAIFYGILSQFGDLAASITKRYFGVKDFGALLPGHGGVLDRICSLLFTIPAVWYFFQIFYGI